METATKSDSVFLERRKFERKAVKIGAKAILSSSDTTIECNILDISQSGAKLELIDVDILPARFKLFVPEVDRMHDCDLVWRDANYVGIRFLNSVTL